MFGASDGPDTPKVNEKALFEDFPKEMLRLFKEVEKYVDVISKKWLNTIDKTTGATKGMASERPGSGRLGLASVGQKAAFVAFTTGYAMYKMTPDTMAAVTQRISADSYAGLSGMSSRQAIVGANRAVGGGATSAMGGTLAQQALFYSGYSANSLSSKNVMSQLSGVSAFSGMSNQAAAGAAGAMNGMNFLRMGINIRNSNGDLKPMDQIINQVYNFLYRGQKITREQAATLRNPNSTGARSIQMIAGGDANLAELITSGLIARAGTTAQNFSSAMQSKDPNKMLDLMGVDKSSPIRANFRGSAAQAKILQSTEQGLVGGYDAAVRTNAFLTSGLADFANALGPATEALMTFKGALQTFPNTGNVGATISGLGNTALNIGGDILAYKALTKYGPKVAKKGLFGKVLGLGRRLLNPRTLIKGAEIAGLEVAGAAGAIETGGASEVAANAAVMALIARGGPSDHGNMGHTTASASHKKLRPVPASTPLTSGYGPRGGGVKTKGFHPGLDFGATQGSSVYAHDAGIVTQIGNEANGYGNWVEIKHSDGTATRYAHLQSISVTRGQKVGAGDVIAKSGNTGKTTAPHLHFEVLVNGKKVDPTPYLMGSGSPSKSNSSQKPAANSSSSGQIKHKGYVENSQVSGSLSSSSLKGLLDSYSSNSFGSIVADRFGNGGAKNLGNNKSLSFISGKTKVTKGIILGTGDKLTWAKTLLGQLGMPVTKDNVNALTTWAAWEGGQWKNSAHYNPLNTTQVFNGSVSMNDLGHGMGVQSYKSWADGYAATIQTLRNGRYKNILAALTAGTSSSDVLTAVNHSPWGTKIPGYGGPNPGVNVGTVGAPAVTIGSSSIHSGTGSTNSTVNLNMTVHIANASVTETERLVATVAGRLKKELAKNPYSLDRIGTSL